MQWLVEVVQHCSVTVVDLPSTLVLAPAVAGRCCIFRLSLAVFAAVEAATFFVVHQKAGEIIWSSLTGLLSGVPKSL